MKRIQKIAMFFLVVLSFAIVLSVVAVLILYFKYDFPRAWAGLGFMGVGGFAGFARMIFKKDPGKVECDERDRGIQRRSAIAGFGAAYMVVGISTMGPFIIIGPNAPITTNWLPLIFGAAGLTNFYAWSIAILTQYGWRTKNE